MMLLKAVTHTTTSTVDGDGAESSGDDGASLPSQRARRDVEGLCVRQKLLINRWFERHKAEIDRHSGMHRSLLAAEQAQLERSHRELLDIERQVVGEACGASSRGDTVSGGLDDEDDPVQKGANDGAVQDGGAKENQVQAAVSGTSQVLMEEQRRVQADIDRLNRLSSEKKAEIQDLEREIRRHTDLVRNESHWKSELARSKAEAERELANCVNKFQHLGLAFERDTYVWDDDGPSSNGGNSTKLRRDALRFAFTLLDPTDPDRCFEFSLAVDVDGSKNDIKHKHSPSESSSYELVDCDPVLTSGRYESELAGMVADLNRTDGMDAFVLGIRQLFVSALGY